MSTLVTADEVLVELYVPATVRVSNAEHMANQAERIVALVTERTAAVVRAERERCLGVVRAWAESVSSQIVVPLRNLEHAIRASGATDSASSATTAGTASPSRADGAEREQDGQGSLQAPEGSQNDARPSPASAPDEEIGIIGIVDWLDREASRAAQARANRGDETLSCDGQIVSRYGVMGGEPCFSGTRITVRAIRALLGRGYDTEWIQREYPTLTVAHLRAARALDLPPEEPEPCGCEESEGLRAEVERLRENDGIECALCSEEATHHYCGAHMHGREEARGDSVPSAGPDGDIRCDVTCPHGDRCTLVHAHTGGHNHAGCECNEPDEVRFCDCKADVTSLRALCDDVRTKMEAAEAQGNWPPACGLAKALHALRQEHNGRGTP